MSTRIINKVENLSLASDTKAVIPSDGLSSYTAYELSLYVDGGNAVYLMHQDTPGQITGHRIPAGGVATLGPLDIRDFPAVYAAADLASSVTVSYAIVQD